MVIRLTIPALLLATFLTLGCSRRPAVEAPVQPEPEPTGSSALTFLLDPALPPRLPETSEELVSPAPLSLPLPAYPVAAIRSGCRNLSVGLRIIVETDGRIGSVQDSPLVPPAEGECAMRLREAAVAAVRGWTFQPAQWRQLEPGDDYDGDGKPDFHRVISVTRVSVYLDVRFDFEVGEASARVRVRS